MSCCYNPDIQKLDENNYVCINCLFLIPIIDEKSNDCCDNMNVSPRWYLYFMWNNPSDIYKSN